MLIMYCKWQQKAPKWSVLFYSTLTKHTYLCFNKAHTHTQKNGKMFDQLYSKILSVRSSCLRSVVMNMTSIHEDRGLIPGLAQWVKWLGVAVSCDVGRRRSLDLALRRLCHRPAAVALIWPLAWEFPYAAGAALKRTKKKKKLSVVTTKWWNIKWFFIYIFIMNYIFIV